MSGNELQELRKSVGITQQSLSDTTGIPLGTIARWESKNLEIVKAIQIGKLNQFFKNFNNKTVENSEPKNSAFKEDSTQYQTTEKIAKGKEAFKVSIDDGARPYYNVDFTEGFEKIFEDEKLAPNYYINYEPCKDVGWWLNVTGNGMHPHISNGDIIAVKIVEDWETFLMPDEIYGIITVNGLKTIRTVCFGNDADYFSLVPSNKNYQTVEIPKNIISTVLKVRTVFKKAF